MIPKNRTLILAGNRKQYEVYVSDRGENPDFAEDYIDGRGGMFHGEHFSKVIVVGTFFYLKDAIKIIDYARACLDNEGALVYDADVKYPPSPIAPAYDNDEDFMKLPKPFLLPKKALADLGYAKFEPKSPKIRTVGEIWPLSNLSAPFQSTQWGYQGSAKVPYVITSYLTKRDGAVTGDGWACSCRSFTQNTPRTPCKHILNVMLKEGKTTNKTAVKLANVNDEKLKAFEKWEREQAAKKPVNPTAGAKLKYFGATGRRFR